MNSRNQQLVWLVLAVLAGGAAVATDLGPFALLLVLGGFALLWGARRPHLLLYGLAFATAAIPHGMAGKKAFALTLGGVPFHLIDLIFLGCMASWGLAAVMAFPRDRGEFAETWRRHSTLLWPFAALMGIVLLSAIVGRAHGNDTWDIVRDLRSAAYYLVLPVAIWTLDTRERTRTLIRSLILGVTVFSILCVITAIADDSFYLRRVSIVYWQGQARIYFHNHYILAFVIPYVAYRLLLTKTLLHRIGSVILLGLFIVALALSLTRNLMGATLGAVLLVPFLLYLRAPGSPLVSTRRLATVLVLVALSGGAAMVGWRALRASDDLGAPSLGSRFATLHRPSEQDSSFRGRIVSYRFGLEDALEYPVLGKGFGMLFRIPWGKSVMRPVRTEGYQPVVDMTPLTVLGKSGSLGVLVLLWFGLTLFWLQWRALRAARGVASTHVLAAVLLASTLGLFISSMLHTVLLTSLTTLPFAMLCAITSHLDWSTREEATGAIS